MSRKRLDTTLCSKNSTGLSMRYSIKLRVRPGTIQFGRHNTRPRLRHMSEKSRSSRMKQPTEMKMRSSIRPNTRLELEMYQYRSMLWDTILTILEITWNQTQKATAIIMTGMATRLLILQMMPITTLSPTTLQKSTRLQRRYQSLSPHKCHIRSPSLPLWRRNTKLKLKCLTRSKNRSLILLRGRCHLRSRNIYLTPSARRNLTLSLTRYHMLLLRQCHTRSSTRFPTRTTSKCPIKPQKELITQCGRRSHMSSPPKSK